MLLGYTRTSWYEPAPPKRVAWADLTAGQKVSAELIGWVRHSYVVAWHPVGSVNIFLTVGRMCAG